MCLQWFSLCLPVFCIEKGLQNYVTEYLYMDFHLPNMIPCGINIALSPKSLDKLVVSWMEILSFVEWSQAAMHWGLAWQLPSNPFAHKHDPSRRQYDMWELINGNEMWDFSMCWYSKWLSKILWFILPHIVHHASLLKSNDTLETWMVRVFPFCYASSSCVKIY